MSISSRLLELVFQCHTIVQSAVSFQITIFNSFQLYEVDTHLEQLRETVVQKCRLVLQLCVWTSEYCNLRSWICYPFSVTCIYLFFFFFKSHKNLYTLTCLTSFFVYISLSLSVCTHNYLGCIFSYFLINQLRTIIILMSRIDWSVHF